MNHFNDISLMLPDYITGRLSQADHDIVEAAIKENPELASELEFQRHISRAVKSENSVNPPGELGWARLSKDIKKNSKAAENPIAANDSLKSRPFWRYAAAILAVAVIGQSAFIASEFSNHSDARYYPVSAATDSYIINVKFKDTALQSDITALIKEVKGNIISGPTQQGIYSVDFKTFAIRAEAENIFTARRKLVQSQSQP